MLYIISDVHGNIEGLEKSLRKHGIIDKKGNRQLARKHKVISIGDLANCVEENVEGDHSCLGLVGNVIDYLIIGNHEMGYFDKDNDFYGFHYYEGIDRHLRFLESGGKIIPAYLHNGTLISHAGVSKSITSVEMDAKECCESIRYHWDAFNYKHSWFSSIGHSRGGRNYCGGILWCDFDREFVPTNFPQIVGHTSRNPYVQMKGNAICIDVGAKDPKGNKPFILEVK